MLVVGLIANLLLDCLSNISAHSDGNLRSNLSAGLIISRPVCLSITRTPNQRLDPIPGQPWRYASIDDEGADVGTKKRQEPFYL